MFLVTAQIMGEDPICMYWRSFFAMKLSLRAKGSTVELSQYFKETVVTFD